jgi:hypothetical protein
MMGTGWGEVLATGDIMRSLVDAPDERSSSATTKVVVGLGMIASFNLKLPDGSPGIRGAGQGKTLAAGDITWSLIGARDELISSAASKVGVGLSGIASFTLWLTGGSPGVTGTGHSEALAAGDITWSLVGARIRSAAGARWLVGTV